MSTSEGKCVLVEVGALISWCICSYRIVMLSVPYMWAGMTFLHFCHCTVRRVFFFVGGRGSVSTTLDSDVLEGTEWLSIVSFVCLLRTKGFESSMKYG